MSVDASPADCPALGKELAAPPERLGLLVMADGAARRSEHSPVHLHPRAELFDTTVAEALGRADTDVPAAPDPELAAELQAAGRGTRTVAGPRRYTGAVASRAPLRRRPIRRGLLRRKLTPLRLVLPAQSGLAVDVSFKTA